MANETNSAQTRAPAAPSAPPPPAQQKRRHSPRSTKHKGVGLSITRGELKAPHRIVIYGTGGIGKSTLAAYLPGVVFIDLEDGTKSLNVSRDSDTHDWPTLRGKLAALAASPPDDLKTVVIDTGTVAEEYAKEYVIRNRLTEKGESVESIEGFGWGKGWQYVYEEFLGLFSDLDALVAIGINICVIAHEVDSPVPNPSGEDFIRWEPHFYSGDKKRRGSIRDRVKQWSDHVLFLAYDISVRDGKGRGSGTRTIYTAEMPTHLAKSRTLQTAIPFDAADPAAIWRDLGILPQTPATKRTTK